MTRNKFTYTSRPYTYVMPDGASFKACVDISYNPGYGYTFVLRNPDSPVNVFKPADASGALPSSLAYTENGVLSNAEWRNSRGKMHRSEIRPAEVTFYDNGVIESASWYVDSVLKREGGGLSSIGWHPDGQLHYAIYSSSTGVKHRLDGPAEAYFDSAGCLITYSWSYLSIEGEHIVENPETFRFLEDLDTFIAAVNKIGNDPELILTPVPYKEIRDEVMHEMSQEKIWLPLSQV